MNWISKVPVEKGFSSDRKYRVTDENGSSYLLREADLTQLERKTDEFRVMERLAEAGLPMCRPAKLWQEAESVCTLHEWIRGEDLEDLLPKMTRREQYALGLEAGRLLRIIHSLPAPAPNEGWAARYEKKIGRVLENYAKCPLKPANEDFFLQWVQLDPELLAQRPMMLQHGDFHRANLMLDRLGQLTVIDFQKFSWGDPWEEFDAITWDVEMAPAFAAGRVDGYFGGPVPAAFWLLLRCYVCRGILGGYAWAAPRGEEQVRIMARHAEMVRGWYADGGTVPGWYANRDFLNDL